MKFLKKKSGFLVDGRNKRPVTTQNISYRLTAIDFSVPRKTIHQTAANKYQIRNNVFGKENDVILEEVTNLINDRCDVLTKNLKTKQFNQYNFWRYFVQTAFLWFM